MPHDETLHISNGTEFYEIPASDLEEARADGFYLPSERGMCIVSDGNEIFEIPIEDVSEAASDGFHAISPLSNAYVDTASSATAKVVAETIQKDAPADFDEPGAELEEPHSHGEPELDDDVPLEIDDSPTEEELYREELQQQFDEATGVDKLKIGWQLYGPTWESTQKRFSTFGISAILHLIILMALTLIVFSVQQEEPIEIVSTLVNSEEPGESLSEELSLDNLDDNEAEADASDAVNDMASLLSPNDPSATMDPSELLTETMKISDESGGADVNGNQSLTGRTQAARGAATSKYGGNAGSEAAVEAGLDWLSRHQGEDGSWCFDHREVVKCNCGSPGSHKGRTGATGLALLCYMGAGYTFAEGDHSTRISKGIQYLLAHMEISPEGRGDLREPDAGNGGIYQHAIATAALCEALSVNNALVELRRKNGKMQFIDTEGRELTYDDLKKNGVTLRKACQLAVNYMLHHQSRSTGGWGYQPQSSGDLSVTGWQVYAMLSAEHAGVPIPAIHWNGAEKYLDRVSHDKGVKYSYKAKSGPKDSMTAVGLFSRMLTGWKRNRPTLKEGVKYLSEVGPNVNGMYYSYYATQVLFAYGDDDEKLWTKWNATMRDQLVNKQSKQGHAAGSWPGGEGQGGRLFETCLSVLTLEIYYRKLPMLQRLAVEPMKLD